MRQMWQEFEDHFDGEFPGHFVLEADQLRPLQEQFKQVVVVFAQMVQTQHIDMLQGRLFEKQLFQFRVQAKIQLDLLQFG